MHQPTRTAGPALSSFGWALSLSVCIHGALLGAWLYARRDQGGPVSVSHKRGGLTVQLRTWTPPRTAVTAPAPQAAHMAMPMPKASLRAPAPAAPPAQRDIQQARVMPPAPPAEPPPPAEPAPTPPPSPPAEQAGARFANLFAPIVSRPLGRGRWSAPAMNMPVEAQAAMQREQAIQGLRQTLQVRADTLRAQLQAEPFSGRCEMRLALERQAARIQCDQQADQLRLMATLGDVIRIQPDMASSPSDNCLSVSERAMQWQDCAIPAQR